MSFRHFLRRAFNIKLDTILYRDDGQYLTIQVKDQICRFFVRDSFFYREMFSNIGTIYITQTKDVARGMFEKNIIHIRKYDEHSHLITMARHTGHRSTSDAAKGIDPHAGILVSKKDVLELLKRFKDMSNKPYTTMAIEDTLESFN